LKLSIFFFFLRYNRKLDNALFFNGTIMKLVRVEGRSYLGCILLGPDNKMSKMKKIISEANNEDEFYTKKLKKVCNFYLS
jgi:hypothetical protein